MNKQQLASKIWESANKMRSKIEANEYKDYILGFIFYKYLSDKELQFMKTQCENEEEIKQILSEEDRADIKHIQSNIGYFISYDNLFSTWLNIGKDFNVSNVTDALSAFDRHIDRNYKKVFDGIFDTLDQGLSKLGETAGKQTKAISDLIHLIRDIPMDGKQGYDVLGYIYEYLISNFAANAGKKAGEFYTPHEVSLLMSEIIVDHLKEKKEIKIYDPTSGSGSLLINIGHSFSKQSDEKNNIKYYAQELKSNTYNLTRMNLVMRGIIPSNIITRNGDTLEEDWPYFDENDPVGTYNPLYVDAVVSNPPYSQKWDPKNKETDPRYSRFGLAPKSKADYAFLLHDLYHIKPDGIMTIVLPHGVLFRGGEEGNIRKNLIEYNNIDTIIGLPANIFFGTGIPTIIMVLKQKRENNDVLIIDASKGFVKEGKNNVLQASDIKKIADTVRLRKNIDKYSRVVSIEEIRRNEYNLNIPRYVDSSEESESWDIKSIMFGGIPKKELKALDPYWNAFPSLFNDLFIDDGSEYVQIKDNNIKDIIREHKDVKKFINNYKNKFDGFDSLLSQSLLNGMNDINVSKEENVIAEDVFKRLSSINLIDEYNAYQVLDNEWTKISSDIEIIQTESFDSIRKVDPNLVIKKKNNKDVEVQEGWKGRIIPFELVHSTILSKEATSLKDQEDFLNQVVMEKQEIIDSLTEDEKQDCSDLLNDDNTKFLAGPLNKAVKGMLKDNTADDYDKDGIEVKLISIKSLSDQEKAVKKDIKQESEKLVSLTKKTIENLSNEDIYMLLEKKWIKPILDGLYKLPMDVVNHLSSKISHLSEKYETTFFELEKEIKEAEAKLVSYLDQLVGNEDDMQGLAELRSLLGGD